MEFRFKAVIYLLFFLSGACALVYEVLWSKYLSLVFGTTIWAISIVTATFMAGLALGSYLLGRYSIDHDRNLLRVYAALEVGIALSALLFPPALRLVEGMYLFWIGILAGWPWVTTGCNLLFSAALLLPPAIFMGGTFPIMCRLFARRKSGGQIGRLYALNTGGATLGALAAGYWLIPWLGLSRTGYLAVAVNALIALAAFLLARRLPAAGMVPISRKRAMQWTLRRTEHRPVLIAIGLVGFFALAYEILWTRVLLLFLGNTVYAFSLMLAAYLIGISLGGLLYARLVRPGMDERKIFVSLVILIGLSVFITAPFYDQLALAFQAAHDFSGERWWLLSTFSFGLVFLVLCLPTILSGALLPAAVAILDPDKHHTGQGVGLVVLYNTIGAVLGSLAAGFLLLPHLGLLSSFRWLATANLALGFFLLLWYRQATRPYWLTPVVALAGVVAVLLPVQWDAKLMNSGVYCYASKYRSMGGMHQVLQDEKILQVIEGRDATVAIHESLDGGLLFFTVNGKTDGGTGKDMATQVLVGQLPLLAHPAPRQVLVIGLGTGITLRGLSAHPVDRIDCVEISPEVVQAESYFRPFNGQVLDDPKVHLHIEDGRHLLLTRKRAYDVIISEPSNPWQAGSANLFTLDFYRLAATRLKENGLFCQWIGLYDITPENLAIACRTFLTVFPEVLVFRSGSDLLLLGSLAQFSFDYRSMKNRFAVPAIAQRLGEIGIVTPADLIARHYLDNDAMLRRFAGAAGPLNTDDRPHLEYSFRFNLGSNTLGTFAQKNAAALLQARQKVWLPLENLGHTPAEVAATLQELGEGFQNNGQEAEGRFFFEKAESLAPGAGVNGTKGRSLNQATAPG